MKMGSIPEITNPHDTAAQLMPWLINGTLAPEEAASVRAHLAVCSSCHADFDAEQRLYDAVRAEGLLVFSGEPSFQKLMARIEGEDFAAAEAISVAAERPAIPAKRDASRHRSTRRQFWRSPATVPWLAAAVVIEALGLGLGAWAWQAHNSVDTVAALTSSTSRSNAAPLYRTLTTPSPSFRAGRRVRVVFQPHLSLDHLQKLLRGVGAHIVDGPTDANVYTLGFSLPGVSVDALDERIAMLRADPNVLFAEPVEVRPP